jgi:ATP-dependent DNA helicase RecQ
MKHQQSTKSRHSGIMQEAASVLHRVFGFSSFRPFQQEAVELVCSGASVLVVLPTGGGKSLVYQVPALVRGGMALVCSPLISLMQDQVDQLQAAGVRAAVWNSTLSGAMRNSVARSAQRGEIDILYVAPEGLFSEWFQEIIGTINLSLIAVDEAHCISEWGHEFRPEYRRLSTLRAQFPHVPIVACTATATAQVRADIVQQLQVPDMQTLCGSFERHNLSLCIEPQRDAVQQIVRILSRHRGASSIIYAATRKRTEEIAQKLNTRGIRALAYHAGMDASTRAKHQRAFANDDVTTIVATVAFGMGIDKSNIRVVIHANLPKSIEGYYQEVGRAGRDGLPSECVVLFSRGDIATQQYLIDQAESDDERARASRQLERITRFARGVECRHAAVLRHFGEDRSEWTCEDRCDVCLAGDISEQDITSDVQKVCSAVARISQGGFPLGASRIAQILSGSKAEAVARYRQLPTFGAMQDRTQPEIRDCIGMCIDRDYLVQEAGKYPVLRLAESALPILRGEERVVAHVRQPRSVTDEISTDYDSVLFDALRHWRSGTAKQASVPPYVICSDKVLVDLAIFLPHTADELLRISGIGAARAERYGDGMLDVITRYAAAHDLVSRMPDVVVREPAEASPRSNTVDETLNRYERGLDIAGIAADRNLAPRTIVNHLAQGFATGRIPASDLQKFVSKPQERVIRAAFAAVGSLEQLSPIKQRLPSDCSYDHIHLVRAVIEFDISSAHQGGQN